MMNYNALFCFGNGLILDYTVKFRANGEILKNIKSGKINHLLDVVFSHEEVTADVRFIGSERHLGNIVFAKNGHETASIKSYSRRFEHLIPESEKATAICIDD